MKLHNLKIDLEAIDLKIRGVKNWEIRYDDRGYSVGDDCFKLIGAIAKMFTCEDYTVWGNQNRYNWNVVADYVLKGKPFDTICCEVVRK